MQDHKWTQCWVIIINSVESLTANYLYRIHIIYGLVLFFYVFGWNWLFYSSTFDPIEFELVL